MESWVLEGDSYSFLCSAPRNFNLRHRDGPNRVEIFDITSLPNSRSGISETTCLCDIFGDDCESPSLSSSPASTSFLKREVDVHLPVDDVNDSSGSYHTAHSSEQLSDTSDSFEDSRDTIKNTQVLLLPETGDPSSPPTDLTLSHDKTAVTPENGSSSSANINDCDLSQAETQQESYLSQNNIESSSHQQVIATSEFRDTNNRVTDSSQDTHPSDLISEIKVVTEQSNTASSEHMGNSTPPKQEESPCLDNQVHTVTNEHTDTSQEITPSEAFAEQSNVNSVPGDAEAKILSPDLRFHCSSQIENISQIQETVDLSTDLINFSLGNGNLTPFQSCPSTPDLSIRGLTPAQSSSPALMDIHSKPEDILEPKDVGNYSPETTSHDSTPIVNNNAELEEGPNTVPSPSPASEDNTEIHFSFEHQDQNVFPEATETMVSSDPKRLSFISDTRESLGSPEVSEFCSLSGSSAAAHPSEPSIEIHSPVGYTISPSPELGRKIFTTEHEVLEFTPETPETDYTVTPTDFRGSFSSHDSKLCLTPESRSVTSTPEIRQDLLTPDSMSTAPSPELRSATCSPEIRAIMCSVRPQNPASPQIHGLTCRDVSPQNKVLPQYSDVEEIRCAESPTSATHTAIEIQNLVNSPTSKLALTSENISRPSSATLSKSKDATSSPEIRDQTPPDRFSDHILVPEPCISLEPSSEEVDLPSLVQDDTESFKSCSPALDEYKDFGTDALSQIQMINDSSSVLSNGKLSVIQMEERTEQMSESISNLITGENVNSVNPQPDSKTEPTAEEIVFLEGTDSCSGTDILVGESGGREKPPVHMPVRPRESPNFFHDDNDREHDRESCRNKGWSKDRVVQEEHTPGKGEGNVEQGSYRGEQVELSFRDRNRKGPASHSAAPSSGDPKSGIPARRYFESPLTTRQQQSLLRAQAIQRENNSGARRVQSAFQSKHSGAGLLPSGCTSENSRMGSEFDEADKEVTWLTDLAFRSLSSPQGEYLDVYSSSHRSSTNVSQQSTADSPGAPTWMSYADFHASALHENDESRGHPSSFFPHGTLDPSRRFEMGSFECVDVAVESKEESKKGKRTVPKRQIQLKRRTHEESKSVENAENVMVSPSTQRHSKDTLLRQHSTPVPVAEHESLSGGETEIQTDKKMLQKSASFDGTTTKTKMATTIIKSVLSKKMDSKEPSRSEDLSPFEDRGKKQSDALSLGTSGNTERYSLSSSLPSECSLSSEDYAGREEKSPHIQKKRCGPKVPPKPLFKPNFIPATSDSGIGALQGGTAVPVMDQVRPRMIDSFESKTPPKKQILRKSEKEAGTRFLGEKSYSDIANTSARNSRAATRAYNRFANRDLEHCATPENQEQQDGRRMFLSKTPEITLKPCTTKDKNKSSLKVSLPPDHSADESQETPEWQTKFKPVTEVESKEDVECKEEENINSKHVMHKVRDVRKLVKNTYNLSFKTSNSIGRSEIALEDQSTQKEKQIQNPQTLHIECKAISRKDKQASDNKASCLKNEPHHPDKSEKRVTSDMNIGTKTIDVKAKTSLPNVTMESKQKTTALQVSDMDTFVTFSQCKGISKPPEETEQSSDIEVPPRPTSKETSTLMFLKDNTSSAMEKPESPASPHGKTVSSNHSVSMLLKEKGMQADIGVCNVLNEGISATPKHINRLEVPLQTCVSERTSNKSQKVEMPCEEKKFTDSNVQATQCVSLVRSSPKSRELRISPSKTQTADETHAALMQPSTESEKSSTHATSVAKIAAPLATSNKAEMRSTSANTKSHAMPVTTSKEIELPIQVRSISSDRPKPNVQSKSGYKQPFSEMRSTSTDFPKTDIQSMPTGLKQQTQKSFVKKSETSVGVVQKEQSTEPASNNNKKLAVSAVSSYKPPSLPVTTDSDTEQKPTTSAGPGRQVSITSVQNPINRQQMDMTVSEEQVMPVSSCASNHPVLPIASQSHPSNQPSKTAPSNKQLHREDLYFHESDDPPSYDERESFSPLLLSDLPPRKFNRHHTTNKPSPCSCASSHSPLGHPYQGSQNCTPPASRSPGQVFSYPGAPPKAQVRPHQCKQDGQPLNYPSVSPKTSVPLAPPMIQPLHPSYPCPVPAPQSYGDEQQPSSTQMERHPANRRSPQAAGSAAYENRSPNIVMDPRSQFFSSHDLPPPFNHDFGSDGPGSSVLYPDNGYGQGPRRVLLDPETGKYFYIEVPMQPLRKMLFDPEIGQYVEVLIPQQAMSHSGMYPPTAAPYPSLHGSGLYAPQYLPYGVQPHAQSAQQPRHPETSVSTSLHQNNMGYGSSASQTPKSEAKSHPSLDQSYLESMYYIPTGMNASPNSTPSDCYHKPSPNMPATGGRRA